MVGGRGVLYREYLDPLRMVPWLGRGLVGIVRMRLWRWIGRVILEDNEFEAQGLMSVPGVWVDL